MSNAEGVFASRFDWSLGTARLAVGDVLVVIGFLVVGELSHNVNPLETPLVVADTIAPFLFGWVVAAFALGAYKPGATRTVKTAILRGALGWVGAAAIGLTLRATPYFHGDSPLAFAMVVTGLGVVALSTWRATVAALR